LRLAWIGTAAALLIAAMAYVLWPRHEPKTQVAYLPVVEYKVLNAAAWPELLLTQRDYDHFAAQTLLAPVSLKGMQTSDFLLAPAATNAAGDASATTLELRLREIASHPDDRLLLLVAAQGVSIDGQAYLLFGDFDAARSSVGKVPIEKLLEQVSSCSAGQKVLVLDAGNIVSDPRFGMLANEFPRLLEKAVRELDDPSVWVLVSNWTWEVSHVSHHLRRSVFSYYVAQGLRGEANRMNAESGDDQTVDLRELYDYVSINVSDWVRQAQGENTSQTPALISGRLGRIQRLADVATVPLMPVLPPDAEPSQEAPAPESTAQASKARSGSGSAASGAVVMAIGMPLMLAQAPAGPAEPSPSAAEAPATVPPAAASDAASPTSEPAPAAPAAEPLDATSDANPAPTGAPTTESPQPQKPPRVLTERERVQATLNEGWALRDRIEQQTRAGATRPSSPADFAPHLWREFQERLLGYETQFRYGADPEYIAKGVRDNVLVLADVVDGKPVERVHRNSLSGPLATQWQEFRRIAARASAPEPEFIVRARAARDDALVRAPFYVRWYALTSVVSPGDEPRFEDVELLLRDVQALSTALDAPRLDSLRRLEQAQLNEMVAQLQADEAQLQNAAPRPGTSTTIAQVECYLSTPLARADERARLLAWLVERNRHEVFVFDTLASSARRRSTRVTDPIGPRDTGNNARWERVRNLARLEAAAAAMVDPGSDVYPSDNSLAHQLRDLQAVVDELVAPIAEVEDESVEEARWSDCRQVGKELEKFYEELTGQFALWRREIGNDAQNPDAPPSPRVLAALERLYRLLEVRDADREGVKTLVELLDVTEDMPVVTEVAFEAPDKLDLDARLETTPMQVVARLRAGRPSDAWLTLEYDADLLEIVDLAGTALVNPTARIRADVSQRPACFSFDGGRALARDMSFQVRALPAARKRLGPGDRVPIVASLYYRDADGKLIGPLEKTIVVRPALPEVELVIEGPQLLRPVGNESLLALRPFPNTTTNYQLKLVNRGTEPQEVQVQLFAVPYELGTLMPKQWPLDELGNPIPGAPKLEVLATGNCTVPPGETLPVSFGSPAPAKPNEGDAAAAAPPPAAATAEGDEPPLKPISYGFVCLLKDKAGRSSIVNLNLEPQRPSDFLETSVKWDPQKAHRVQVEVRPKQGNIAIMPPGGCQVRWRWQGEIDPAAPKKEEADLVPPDFSPAVLYADVPQSRSEPVVVRLDVNGFPRAFLQQLEIDRPSGAPLRDQQEVRITRPAENGFAYKAPAESVSIAFEVDAPADAFSPSRPEADLVEIGLVEPEGNQQFVGKTLRFYSDRQVEAYLAKASEDGTLTIKTEISDFEVAVPTDARSNEHIGIVARLARGPREVKTFREVFLDATRPEVLVVGQLPLGTAGGISVAKGQDARVFAEIEDVGGVEKVEFFLVKPSIDVDTHWEHDDKLPPESATAGVQRNNRWEATLPTGESKDANLKLVVRATDRVGLRNKKAVDLEIVAPAMPDEPGKPKTMLHDLKGVVTGEGVSLIRVKLEDSDRAVQSPRVNQEFTFDKLPPGEYTLTVTATARNITQPPKSVSVTLPQEGPTAISF